MTENSIMRATSPAKRSRRKFLSASIGSPHFCAWKSALFHPPISARVFMNRSTMAVARNSGPNTSACDSLPVTISMRLMAARMPMVGTPADLRAFPQWFFWSPMADTVRSALADRSRTVPRSSKCKLTESAVVVAGVLLDCLDHQSPHHPVARGHLGRLREHGHERGHVSQMQRPTHTDVHAARRVADDEANVKRLSRRA